MSLTGVPVDTRYPHVKLIIDNCIHWQNTLIEHNELHFENLKINSSALNVELHYINKQAQDTKVIDNQIIANQCVHINWIEINQVKLLPDFLRQYSLTTYHLTEQQKNAYNAQGNTWKDVRTNVLYNNGIWRLSCQKPILTNLLKQKTLTKHVFETSHCDILLQLQQYFKES